MFCHNLDSKCTRMGTANLVCKALLTFHRELLTIYEFIYQVEVLAKKINYFSYYRLNYRRDGTGVIIHTFFCCHMLYTLV